MADQFKATLAIMGVLMTNICTYLQHFVTPSFRQECIWKHPLQNIFCLHLCVRDHIKYVHWGSDVCAKLCHLCWRISVDQALGLSCLWGCYTIYLLNNILKWQYKCQKVKILALIQRWPNDVAAAFWLLLGQNCVILCRCVSEAKRESHINTC